MNKLKPIKPLTDWQKIFLLSRIYSGVYFGESLPINRRIWPQNGFLTRRLREMRASKDASTFHGRID